VSPDFAASSGTVAPVKRKKRTNRPKVAKEPEKAEAKKEESGSFEFKLPSFSAPEAKESPVAKKVIISPADELDPDEVSMNATNLPLLAALFFGPSFVYIAFYVLGSLDII